MLHILFDGWALCRTPGSPTALHLAAVLASLSGSIEATVALPGEATGMDWMPQGVKIQVRHAPHSTWGQAVWEQWSLGHIARQVGADWLYLSTARAPVFSLVPHLSSPSGWQIPGYHPPEAQTRDAGLGHRIRDALGQGGLAASPGVLWPQDLPLPDGFPNLKPLPPLAHPLFQPYPPPPDHQLWAGFDLPQTYILYHGPVDQASLGKLFEAWSWAAGPVGEYYPLLIYGTHQAQKPAVNAVLRETGLADSVRFLPPTDAHPANGDPANIAALYQGCTALFQPGMVSPWGDPVCNALACGKPIISTINALSSARVGPAGYLAPEGDARQLGAALITVCVEEEVAQALGAAAVARASTWSPDFFRQACLSLLTKDG